MRDSCTPHSLPFSIPELMGDYNALDFLLFINAEILSQHAGSYASLLQNIRMVREEIAKLSNEHVFPPHWIKNDGLTFDDIRMSLELLKHRSVRLSQKTNALLEGQPCRLCTEKWTFRLMITDPLTLTLISDCHQLPTTLLIPDYYPFQRKTPFSAIPLPL